MAARALLDSTIRIFTKEGVLCGKTNVLFFSLQTRR
jgi:hypothetical protein